MMKNITKMILSGVVGAACATACGAIVLIKKRDQYIKTEDLYDSIREILEDEDDSPISISDILDGNVVDIANKYGDEEGEEKDVEISGSSVTGFSSNEELAGNNTCDKNEDSNDEK